MKTQQQGSEVRRYFVSGHEFEIELDNEGDFVDYSDYEKLQNENKKLKEELADFRAKKEFNDNRWRNQHGR